jgi:serine/threonine-protein kinase
MADLQLHEVPEHGEDDSVSDGDGTRRFKAVFRSLGLDDRAARRPLAPGDRLTSRRAPGHTSIPPPAEQLPLITVGPSASDAELVLKTEIGDGGMGVIFAASQRSLGREVAVKRLVPEATGDAAINALVQEARVTGSLEHPNVVPVHALGADVHGRPVMVMRRVHGTPWSTLLRGKLPPEWAPAGDVVAGHLEILLQVINAVWFAHSRGIIHGDLKPENVMLGDFGEVYVLDWGAALSMRKGDARGLPYAGDVSTVTGTPAYMAPEMIGMGAAISERTDVYLLGAVLHEILTGAPPHAGASLYAVMKDAFVSRPFAYPASVPRELAEICHRAMAPDPNDRYASAQELRRAVAAHLEHRASIALGAEAAARLDKLLAAIAAGAERRREAYHRFAECRFGFQQAIRAWSGNTDAREGLDRAVTAMIEMEIAAGDAGAAALLAEDLPDMPPALRDKLAALTARAEAEGAELSRLRGLVRELDDEAYARPRRVFVAVIAALGAASILAAAVIDPVGATSTGRMLYALVNPLVWIVVASAAAFIGRKAVFTTRPSRIIVGGALAAGAAVLANRVLTILVRGRTVPEAITGDLLTLGVIAVMIALSANRRFLRPAGIFLVSAALSAFYPARAALLLALSLLLFAAGSAWEARQDAKDRGQPFV